MASVLAATMAIGSFAPAFALDDQLVQRALKDYTELSPQQLNDLKQLENIRQKYRLRRSPDGRLQLRNSRGEYFMIRLDMEVSQAVIELTVWVDGYVCMEHAWAHGAPTSARAGCRQHAAARPKGQCVRHSDRRIAAGGLWAFIFTALRNAPMVLLLHCSHQLHLLDFHNHPPRPPACLGQH